MQPGVKYMLQGIWFRKETIMTRKWLMDKSHCTEQWHCPPVAERDQQRFNLNQMSKLQTDEKFVNKTVIVMDVRSASQSESKGVIEILLSWTRQIVSIHIPDTYIRLPMINTLLAYAILLCKKWREEIHASITWPACHHSTMTPKSTIYPYLTFLAARKVPRLADQKPITMRCEKNFTCYKQI